MTAEEAPARVTPVKETLSAKMKQVTPTLQMTDETVEVMVQDETLVVNVDQDKASATNEAAPVTLITIPSAKESPKRDRSPPRMKREIECPGAPKKKKRRKLRNTPQLNLDPEETHSPSITVVVRSLEDELRAAAEADDQIEHLSTSDASCTLLSLVSSSNPSTPPPTETLSSPKSPPTATTPPLTVAPISPTKS
ncbi:hypothetical protein AC1031_017009 [Aphanomyces cochlioides]|nr:hypothetical protein AC1031_017009 [Aphanomyces cochlioides]